MTFLKWLHRRVPQDPSKAKPTTEGESATTGDLSPADEVDLDGAPVLRDALSCARHALVMEFRERNRFDPTPEDLSDWVRGFWSDRDRIRTIIRTRNGMALSLGERFPTFWERLERRVLRDEER